MTDKIYLLKYVLTSLPLFYVSFFYMSATAVKEMKRIQKSFFVGLGLRKQKLPAWGWDKVCESKDKDDLGGLLYKKI